MNDKFYTLPEEKQQRILNAGFCVFSQNSYKKSSMQEIAGNAGISKSLLFYYFRNKKGLYPTFVVKAFYESNSELSAAIQESYRRHFEHKATAALARVNPNELIPGLDLNMMYREMYLASVGYLWEIFQQGGQIDADRLEKDFSQLLAFWKTIYLRKEEQK